MLHNLPHITPIEIAVFGSAVVLLYIVPALFTVGSMMTATLLVQAWVWRDRIKPRTTTGS